MRTPAFIGCVAPIAVVISLTAIFLCFEATAQTTARQLVQNSVPPAVSQLTSIGRLPEGTPLNLSIGLPLRNKNVLDELVKEMYDPASPNYHHFLTPDQFTEQFGPTENDYQTAENFFRTNGLTVTGEHRNRLVLDVSGSAANVERVFHVNLRTYHHPTENRTFYSPDTAPSLDLNVPILHVSGLDNFSLIRPRFAHKIPASQIAKTSHETGSGPGGTYIGNDLRAAYLPGVSLTGKGQTVGLLEFDAYYSNDITAYEGDAGLSGVIVTNVAVAGGVSSPGPGNGEVALDIDVAMSIAPGLSRIVVYETANSWDAILAYMADDTVDSPKQFSCSWGNISPSAPDTTAEGIFEQMDAQGQSFFDASGDTNAFFNGIPFPSESTNITQVGATTLTTTGPGGAWLAECVWNWGGITAGIGSVGTSGGVSGNFKIPYWQQGISTTANEGSTTMRNVPDVAMTGDNIFEVADDGTGYYVGGTSCAAPAWAGFMALVNQQAAAAGNSSAGFINPAIYTIGKSANYRSDFRDIVTGNNFWAQSTNKFPAVPGYDLCTGWGTFGGDTLIDALAGTSDSLSVAPGMGFVTFGAPGGPFTPASLTFSLTNSSASSLDWSLINTSEWLTASASAGTLAAGSPATNISVSLNVTANNLPLGLYTSSLLFSNQTTHAVRTRQFTLSLGQSLVQNNLDNFALLDWAQSGGVYRSSKHSYPVYNWMFEASNGEVSAISPQSGTYCEMNSCLGMIGYLSQNIPTVPGQSYLLSFWFTSSGAEATEQFLVNWNTNSTSTNTILSLLNPSQFGWTYTNFILTATTTNTTLQFGGRNDHYYFGLENVSVLPIPTPNIRDVAHTPTGVSLAWNSMTNLKYQVQYSTNLLPNNWLNLNSYTATGPVLAVTNPPVATPEFYRVLRFP